MKLMLKYFSYSFFHSCSGSNLIANWSALNSK